MPNQQLLDYINFKTKSGVSNEEIKKLLLESGWKEEDINGAFSYVSANPQIDTTEIPRKTNNSSGKMVSYIILFLIIVGASFTAYKFGFLPIKTPLNDNVVNQSNIPTSATTVATSSADEIVATTTSICNNYDCLIAAASQCQSISALIDLQTPSPIFPEMMITLKSKISIKEGGSLAKCELDTSSIGDPTVSISKDNRDKLLAQGYKQSDIDSQIQEINNSLKGSQPNSSTSCESNAIIITQYLKDLKDQKRITSNINTKDGTSTVVFTTSLGQKLTCTNKTSNQ